MDDVLVIGAGPAGLLAAWVARQRGAKVKVMASGIGTTHVSPGWIGILHDEDGTQTRADERGQAVSISAKHRNETSIPQVGTEASAALSEHPTQPAKASTPDIPSNIQRFVAVHPQHPYALAGIDALRGGIAALCQVGQAAGLRYLGDLSANFRLPTALGAVAEAALVPESFAAGDLRLPGPMLIAGPAGWRDFYPRLCAENLTHQGYPAQGVYFDLPEMAALSRFDATPLGLAGLFEQAVVRAQVAAQLKPRLDGATRVGFPAVLGLHHAVEVWRELQDRLGVPVFEIPTLPPSVPGIRLFNAFKAALTAAGVPILLDMTATKGLLAHADLDSQSGIKAMRQPPSGLAGLSEQWQQPAEASTPATTASVYGNKVTGVVVPDVVRDRTYRADTYILATGGLYGGGIISDYRGTLREAVFGLPLHVPGEMEEWFNDRFLPPVATLHAMSLQGHPIHRAGVRVNGRMQPLDEAGNVVLENVRIAGRLLAGYDPLAEGSTEGVWLATAYRAASSTI
ncbi:MAG: anaerobic glycerol-3-phosphate dehydrogenase subunit B [Anaerolineae bacterium]